MSRENLDQISDSNLHLNIDIKLPHPVHHHHFKSMSPSGHIDPLDEKSPDNELHPNIYSKPIGSFNSMKEYADPVREAYVFKEGLLNEKRYH